MIDWKDKREFWIAGAKIADPEAERLLSRAYRKPWQLPA